MGWEMLSCRYGVSICDTASQEDIGSVTTEHVSREELEARLAAYERRERRRRWPRITLVVVAALVALTAGDWWLRNWEMHNLLTKVEASEKPMATARDGMSGLVQAHAGEQLTTEEINTVRASMAQIAEHGATGVITTGDEVGVVTVAPWHRGIAEAKTRYVAHSDAWRRHLTAIAADPDTYGHGGADISGTFLSAENASKEAIPMFALYDLRERIDTIFAD